SVAENDAVEEAPLHVREGDVPEGAPARGAEGDSGFFVGAARFFHHGDERAGDERKGDERGGDGDAGEGEHYLEIVAGQPRAEITAAPEDDDEDESRDHRRHRDREVDEGDEERFATEIELGDGPGGGK